MRITQIVPSLELRHGGPSVSVPNLSQSLAVLGHEVQLLSTLPAGQRRQEPLFSETKIFPREWPEMICPAGQLRSHLAQSEFDVVHHHGLWLRTLHYAHQQAKRRDRPLVISPRGMMTPWAWQHRRWKKSFASALVHPGALAGTAGWHATSPEEATDIRGLGFPQPICVAPNGVTAPTDAALAEAKLHWQRQCPEASQRPTALFYARFHPKKRVLELIEQWVEHAPSDWLLLMVGLPQEYSVAQLSDYVLRARGRDRIRVLDGEGVPAPYAAASLYLLPSHSENFGLTIAEALAHGLPAIVTNTTPWQKLNEHGGWCVSWDEFGATLATALKEGADRLKERGVLAKKWVLSEYSWSAAAQTVADFYRQLARS